MNHDGKLSDKMRVPDKQPVPGFPPTANSSDAQSMSMIQPALNGMSAVFSIGGRAGSVSRTAASGGHGSYTNTVNNPDNTTDVYEYKAWRLNVHKSHDEITSWDYDGLGYVDSIKTKRNGIVNTTHFGRDSQNRISSINLPDPNKAPISITYWGNTDRIKKLTRSDGTWLWFEYDNAGRIICRRDTGDCDLKFTYDSQGRCRLMEVPFPYAVNVIQQYTEWRYDQNTGLPYEKYVNGTLNRSWTHRQNGQLASEQKGNGATVGRVYDQGGFLSAVNLSGGGTGSSAINVTYNRLGQKCAMSFVGGSTLLYNHTMDGLPLAETVVGAGAVSNYWIAYDYYGSSDVIATQRWVIGGSGSNACAFSYDNFTRLASVTMNGATSLYSYVPGSTLVSNIVVANSLGISLSKSFQWDYANMRPIAISYTVGGVTNTSFAYQYETNTDRIAAITYQDGSKWTYSYGAKGRLATGKRFFPDGTPWAGREYGYNYDDVGNTTAAGPLEGMGIPRYQFMGNWFNTHTERHWGSAIDITGYASADATVVVNNVLAQRKDRWFRAVLSVDNQSAPVVEEVVIYVARTNTPTGTDVVGITSGKVSVAKAVEPITCDGAMQTVADSRRTFLFNPLGWLIHATHSGVSGSVSVDCNYYPDGRRAQKTVFVNGITNRVHSYYYDRWNLLAETVTRYPSQVTTNYSYTWGLDLAGQRSGRFGQESGGIGGLLAITESCGSTTNIYFPIADHNGNIMKVLDGHSGETVAEFEYDPFGVIVGKSGTKANVYNLRFQSKYYDEETGLYYFGYRYYDPASTKWLTYDPLEEEAGINLTAFCRNDPINNVDPLGLRAYGKDFVGQLGWMDWIEKDYTQEEVDKVYAYLATRDRHIYNPGLGNTAADREASRSLLEKTLGVPVAAAWNPSFSRLGRSIGDVGATIGHNGLNWNPVKQFGNVAGGVMEFAGVGLDWAGVTADVVVAGVEKVPLVRKVEPTYLHSKHLYSGALKHVMKQEDPNAMVYGWMHSEGAIHGGNILDSLTEDELRYVRARTFGAGGYMFRREADVKHYGNVNSAGNKDFVPQLAGLNAVRNKDDINWKPVNKGYVHGFESYVESHIIGLSKDYFRENAANIIGR